MKNINKMDIIKPMHWLHYYNRNINIKSKEHKFKEPFPFFNEKIKHLRKNCDYVLLAEHRDVLYILIIELKNDKTGDADKQVEATNAFVNYILETARRIGKAVNNPTIQTIIVKQILKKRIRKNKLKMTNFETKNGHIIYSLAKFRIKTSFK